MHLIPSSPFDPDQARCECCPEGLPIVGRSAGFEQAMRTLQKVARSGCNPVLILGPTGTGKELAAQAVHYWRHGAGAPFVAVNCAALTANLLESELFGHVRGAFTGADRDKTGLFEAAAGGTIFLDEISEMPLELQAKLLRVLQERTFRKVGGTSDQAVTATVVASSNRQLLGEVAAGRFRKDLYYRLAVFPVELPALASDARRADIVPLAEHFLRTSDLCEVQAALRLRQDAIGKLEAHDWPGNIRELRNVIQRAVILADGNWITGDNIIIDSELAAEENAAERSGNREIRVNPEDLSLETAEREFIVRALRETGGQRTRAAALLGITRATLHAKLKRYEIEPSDLSGDTSASDGTARSACA